LNGHRRANRAGFCDVSPKPNEVRMRHNSVRNINSEVVGWIACASLRHEDEAPRTIVGRSRLCSTSWRKKTAYRRCVTQKNFHRRFSEALSVSALFDPGRDPGIVLFAVVSQIRRAITCAVKRNTQHSISARKHPARA
jgi:hypothetical protein